MNDPAEILRRLVTREGDDPEGDEFLSYVDTGGYRICPWCDEDDIGDPANGVPLPYPHAGIRIPPVHHPDNGCPWYAALQWHKETP